MPAAAEFAGVGAVHRPACLLIVKRGLGADVASGTQRELGIFALAKSLLAGLIADGPVASGAPPAEGFPGSATDW